MSKKFLACLVSKCGKYISKGGVRVQPSQALIENLSLFQGLSSQSKLEFSVSIPVIQSKLCLQRELRGATEGLVEGFKAKGPQANLV